jgi:hypothetical protein
MTSTLRSGMGGYFILAAFVAVGWQTVMSAFQK